VQFQIVGQVGQRVLEDSFGLFRFLPLEVALCLPDHDLFQIIPRHMVFGIDLERHLEHRESVLGTERAAVVFPHALDVV